MNWDFTKINDLVRGLTHNLKLAKQHNLQKLYMHTLDRLNTEYIHQIASGFSAENLELLELLLETNKYSEHTLHVFDKCLVKRDINLEEALIQLDRIKNSFSYKIGRTITAIPKKIIKFISFWRVKKGD